MPRHRTEATKSPPRIMVEITERQWSVFKNHLPYGFQKQVFKAIIEDMVQMWEEFGDDFTRAIIAKNLTYRQFMQDYEERNYGYFKGSEESRDKVILGHGLGGAITIPERDPSYEENQEST